MITEKKFVETFDVEDWEVDSESGWQDIVAVGKTIPYDVYEIILENSLKLKCANTHILIKQGFSECYVEDLHKDDLIMTKQGISKIVDIKKLNYKDNMYDIEINSNNHTYYTNDILSHNTMWMCNLAAKSVMMGHNTAYITLELQKELVNMRIGANMLSVPLDDYENFAKDQPLLKQKLTQLKQKSLRPVGEFHVQEFPSSTLSVNDLGAYLRKAQELLGYKFENVFIDYLNIMKNWRNPNTEYTYMKMKQICEDIRAMGQENSWSIISVTQTNRSGWETTDLNIISISESAALLHTVDVLFGIITNAESKARGEYFLKCLANRVAGYENTKKRYTIDWKYARIEEDRMSPIQDMDFIINSVVAGHKHPRTGRTSIDAVISNKVKPAETIPDDIPIKNANITGNELFNI